MNYRIIVETEESGKKWYYVQKRWAFFFWKYLREVRDMTMTAYRIEWDTLEKAEQRIQDEINYRKKKIVKREVHKKLETIKQAQLEEIAKVMTDGLNEENKLPISKDRVFFHQTDHKGLFYNPKHWEKRDENTKNS